MKDKPILGPDPQCKHLMAGFNQDWPIDAISRNLHLIVAGDIEALARAAREIDHT
ncbi:hypothetical protein ACVH8U_000443 [Yersinia enterocolitica]